MTDLPGRRPPPLPETAPTFREQLENFRLLGRLLVQIWHTSPPLAIASVCLRLLGALPMLTVSLFLTAALVGVLLV